MTKSKILNRIIQVVFLVILAYFMVPIFADSLRKFNPADWKINYWLLIASLLVMQVVLYAQSAIWSTIVSFFDKSISYNKAFKIAYLAQLGRYLPGRIWQLFGMIYLAAKEGITKEEATVSFILSQLFATPPGLLIVVVYLFILETAEKYHNYIAFAWVGVAAMIAFLVVFLLPRWLRACINFATRLMRQNPVEFKLEKKVGMKVLFFYFVTWNLYGVSFYLFLLSILPGYEFSLIEIIGAWTLAYLVGYWAIVLPAGIGAREAALIILLAPIIGAERAGIAVIGARLWSMLGEIICTVLAWRVK
jgi:uncharacterized membrane protein YbhN (UPF0104 family)